jgi:hypothetical protein
MNSLTSPCFMENIKSLVRHPTVETITCENAIYFIKDFSGTQFTML